MSKNTANAPTTISEIGGGQRLAWIDSCKGIAMLLVVFGHIAEGYMGADYFPQYGSMLQTIYNIIYSFHMFLFFIISGFVFFKAYLNNFEGKKYRYYKQLINIAWIYFAFSIIQWIFKYILSGNVNNNVTIQDLILFPIKPIPPYWYLWVLFFLYIIFAFFKKKGLKNNYIFISSIFCGIVGSVVRIYFIADIGKIFYYVFPFAIGILIACDYIKCPKLFSPLFDLLGVISIATFAYMYIFKVKLDKIPVVSFVVAVIISFFVFSLCKDIFTKTHTAILSLIGRYSMEIYVIHCFITAGNRVFLPKLGINNFYLNVFTNIIMAVFLPILFSYLAKKLHIHEYIFKPASLLYKRTNLKSK